MNICVFVAHRQTLAKRQSRRTCAIAVVLFVHFFINRNCARRHFFFFIDYIKTNEYLITEILNVAHV